MTRSMFPPPIPTPWSYHRFIFGSMCSEASRSSRKGECQKFLLLPGRAPRAMRSSAIGKDEMEMSAMSKHTNGEAHLTVQPYPVCLLENLVGIAARGAL